MSAVHSACLTRRAALLAGQCSERLPTPATDCSDPNGAMLAFADMMRKQIVM